LAYVVAYVDFFLEKNTVRSLKSTAEVHGVTEQGE